MIGGDAPNTRAAARYGRYVDNADGVEPQAFFWRRVVQLVRTFPALIAHHPVPCG